MKATHDHPPETVDGVAVTYRPIDRYPANLFGDDGAIWSRAHNGGLLTKWRRLKGSVQASGHLIVAMRNRNGHRDYVLAHRLILEAHVGPCPPGMEACHEPDPTPHNNRLSNLRWDTSSANRYDAYKHSHLNITISDDYVREIRRLHHDGLGYPAIAARLGITRQSVWRISTLRGRIMVPIEPNAATS